MAARHIEVRPRRLPCGHPAASPAVGCRHCHRSGRCGGPTWRAAPGGIGRSVLSCGHFTDDLRQRCTVCRARCDAADRSAEVGLFLRGALAGRACAHHRRGSVVGGALDAVAQVVQAWALGFGIARPAPAAEEAPVAADPQGPGQGATPLVVVPPPPPMALAALLDAALGGDEPTSPADAPAASSSLGEVSAPVLPAGAEGHGDEVKDEEPTSPAEEAPAEDPPSLSPTLSGQEVPVPAGDTEEAEVDYEE